MSINCTSKTFKRHFKRKIDTKYCISYNIITISENIINIYYIYFENRFFSQFRNHICNTMCGYILQPLPFITIVGNGKNNR